MQAFDNYKNNNNINIIYYKKYRLNTNEMLFKNPNKDMLFKLNFKPIIKNFLICKYSVTNIIVILFNEFSPFYTEKAHFIPSINSIITNNILHLYNTKYPAPSFFVFIYYYENMPFIRIYYDQN